jgi:uncharacterized protein with HEPN domain
MRDPKERLRDILEAIEHIERYALQGRGAFERDELIQNWIVRHLQIIGEAARATPQEIRAMAPDVPWSQVIGMRHILVHDYFRIDTEIVWNVVENDLQGLKRSLQRLLEESDIHLRMDIRHFQYLL